MIPKLSLLVLLLALSSCGQFKLGLTNQHTYSVEPFINPLTIDQVTGAVQVTFSLSIKDKMGAVVPKVDPKIFFEDDNTDSVVWPSCSETNDAGISLCTLSMSEPQAVSRWVMKTQDQNLKFSTTIQPLELWPAPVFTALTPSMIDHDLTTQQLTFNGNFFHQGMRIHVGTVECLNLTVTSTTSASCTIASDTAGMKTIALRSALGHAHTYASAVERRDITAPAAPVVSLHSALISSSLNASFTVADCLDRPSVLVSVSPVAPSSTSPSWQSCVTTAGGITATLIAPATQGGHTFYVWAKDTTGNISTSTSLSMTYDSTAPTASLDTVASLLRGGSQITIPVSASDTNGLSTFALEYAADGSTFSSAVTLATGATSATWTVPLVTISAARLRLRVLDGATPPNATIILSAAFDIDSTAPATPVASLASSSYTTSTSIPITISSCTGASDIFVNSGATPAANAAGWQSCSTSAGAITGTIPSTQGTHQLHVWAKDAAGNVSAAAAQLSVIYDTVAPVLAFENTSSKIRGGGTNINFLLTEANASSSQTISVAFNDGSTTTNSTVAVVNGPLNQRSFTLALGTPASQGTTVSLTITYADLAGNTSSVTRAFTVDVTPPSVDTFIMNTGDVATYNNNVTVQLNAHDVGSNVVKFCIKYNDPAAPNSAHPCWKNLSDPSPGISPASSITFSGYYFQLGFSKGDYTSYVWVMDEVGLISTNSSTINTDSYLMAFDPGTPPTINKLTATNSDTAPNPAPSSYLTFSNGQNLYVKWSASDIEGLSANPISIHYSLDSVNYSLIPGGSNLPNAVNGSCTIDSSFTGCAVLSAPSASFFKIRVVARDQLTTTVFYSTPLNDSKVRIFAGNTEDGVGGSARSALFFTRGKAKESSLMHKHMLVTSEDGKFFYIDPVRGLLWIDPNTGILERFIPITGTVSGNGGPVSAATLKQPYLIVLDHLNNLLIWDDIEIRKVDLQTMTISRLVGGGAITAPSTPIPALSVQLERKNGVFSTFVPLPNGDIIFSGSDASVGYWRYRASDQMVAPVNVTGSMGMYFSATEPWAGRPFADLGVAYNYTTSNFTFLAQGFYYQMVGDALVYTSRLDTTTGSDLAGYPGFGPYNLPFVFTSMTTGLDGKLYGVPRRRLVLHHYDPISNANVPIVGSGAEPTSPCPELTPALTCAVDLDTIFVAKNGRPYFIDQGLLRSVNENGLIITLAGQYPSYGDGVPAMNARIGAITDIQFGDTTVSDDEIIVLDNFSSLFREVKINGTMRTLGDACYFWGGPFAFATDTATGDIISSCAGGLRRFDRSTDTWSVVAGGGTYPYYTPAADGRVGTDINMESGYNGYVLGFINGQVFFNKYSWNGTTSYAANVKMYDANDQYRQSHLMGTLVYSDGFADGSPMASTPVAQNISNIEYSVPLAKYLIGHHSGSLWSGTPGGTLNLVRWIPNGFRNFTHMYEGGDLVLYYCGGSTWSLYKYNVNTQVVTPLSWADQTLQCYPDSSILYRSSTNSLIFAARQNGLGALVEYDLN